MNDMVQIIESKLLDLDEHVFYGKASPLNEYNYIIFKRDKSKKSANKTSKVEYYSVGVVRENYIPDGTDDAVINAITDIPGFRVSDADMTYGYIKKPGTNTTVEVLSIQFARAVK